MPAEPKPKFALQIRYYWGSDLVGASLHPRPKPIVVGTKRADFLLTAEQLGGRSRFTIARPLGETFGFCFDGSMQGLLHRDGEILPLSVLRSRIKPDERGVYVHALGPEDVVWLDLGGVRAGLSYVPAAHTRRSRWIPVALGAVGLFIALVLGGSWLASPPAYSADRVRRLLKESEPACVLRPIPTRPTQEGPVLEATVVEPALFRETANPANAVATRLALDYQVPGSDLGRVGKEALAQTIRLHREEVQTCFRWGDSPQGATARVGFLLNDTGEVVSTWALESSPGASLQTQRCLLGRFRTWAFPRFSPGRYVFASAPVVAVGQGEWSAECPVGASCTVQHREISPP